VWQDTPYCEPTVRTDARSIARLLSLVIPGRRNAPSPESIPPVPAMACYVYLLASKKHGTLYLGVTNDIVRRGYGHRTKAVQAFTRRYGVDKLVWFEIYDDAMTAIAREKELKKWRRDWKIRLIEAENPGWVDLYPGIANRHRGYGFRPAPQVGNCRPKARPGMTAAFLNPDCVSLARA
jgi:putative endonuclease